MEANKQARNEGFKEGYEEGKEYAFGEVMQSRNKAKQAGIQQVVEEIIKDMNIPVRYSHNATCYDCMERIKGKYLNGDYDC